MLRGEMKMVGEACGVLVVDKQLLLMQTTGPCMAGCMGSGCNQGLWQIDGDVASSLGWNVRWS